MSKFDEHIEKCLRTAEKLKLSVDKELLVKVAKGLGPSIYNKDASMVSCSDKTELTRIKKNFLMRKLGMKEEQEAEMEEVIVKVCGEMKGNKTKWRALFYYILVEHTQSSNVY